MDNLSLKIIEEKIKYLVNFKVLKFKSDIWYKNIKKKLVSKDSLEIIIC